MRFAAAAATLAALALAAPAAAQPNALEVARGVVTQLDRNAEGVNDYTLTLRVGPIDTDVYVYRDGDEWEVASNGNAEISDMLEGLVMWPAFDGMGGEFPDPADISDADLAELEQVLRVTEESLDGRPAHVLFMVPGALMDDEEMPDSLRMYVDPSTWQILRLHVAGTAEGMEEIGGTGDMAVTMDFRDYRETDGLTVPRRLRMDLRVEMEMSDEERQMMTTAMQAAQMQMGQDDSEESRQMAVMIDMFVGLLTDGRMEMDVEVADVRVNQGPPAWFEG